MPSPETPLEFSDRNYESDIADPDAFWAEIRRLFAERRRYQLQPARTLAGLRQSRVVSQEALARKLGIKQARLSKFERHSDPRLSALWAYVEALGGTLLLVARLPDRDVHLALQRSRPIFSSTPPARSPDDRPDS